MFYWMVKHHMRSYTDKPPPISTFELLGVCAMPMTRIEKDKFASRSRKCIFVGYPFGKKGWRLYDLESDEYFILRDVIFVEAEFSYFNNVVNSSLTENRVVDFSVDDEDLYMQNDMEEQ